MFEEEDVVGLGGIGVSVSGAMETGPRGGPCVPERRGSEDDGVANIVMTSAMASGGARAETCLRMLDRQVKSSQVKMASQIGARLWCEGVTT